MALVKYGRLSVQPVTAERMEIHLPHGRHEAMTLCRDQLCSPILAAAIAAWLASAAWYMSLGKIYTAALGKTPEQMAAERNKPGAFLPFVYAFVANIIIAWMLAGVLGHLGPGQVTLKNGVDLRRVPVVRLHPRHHGGQLQLFRPRSAAPLHRCRQLADRALGVRRGGRRHRRVTFGVGAMPCPSSGRRRII